MRYTANWIKTKEGNGIKEGSVLRIKVDGAHYFSGGIYKNGFPVIAFQTNPGDNDEEILIKRKDISLKGKATLKVRAYDSRWRGQGWDDEFNII